MAGVIRIVVAGDEGTGKSSLIASAVSGNFPGSVPPVLPPSRMPDDFYPHRVPITIIDTSSSTENNSKLVEDLKSADVVVLTYACDRPETFDRLSTFWVPDLRRLEARVPVIVVGCKSDLRAEYLDQESLVQLISPIMQQFHEIETCIECSSYKQKDIPVVFSFAQRAVTDPIAPLFDKETHSLRPPCITALKRIFMLCDSDHDGALSDAELNDFQAKCFDAPLQPSVLAEVKNVVQVNVAQGVNERGVTLPGFLFLHFLFIHKGSIHTTWTVLRKFGYNNDVQLIDDILPPTVNQSSDQREE